MPEPCESYWKRVTVGVSMPTRTIIVAGELTIDYATGRDEDYVDDFLEELRQQMRMLVVKRETVDRRDL